MTRTAQKNCFTLKAEVLWPENTFGVIFLICPEKNNKSRADLFARVTVNGRDTEISLKEKISTADWDWKRSMVTRKGAKAINDYIDSVRARLKQKYRELQEREYFVTAHAVKMAYLGKHVIAAKKGHTLIQLFKYHNKI